MRRVALIAFVIGAAACSAGDVDPSGDDTTSDSPTGCAVFLVFDPMTAIAGPSTPIRAIANVGGAPGVLGYTWEVTHGTAHVPYAYQQADQSEISFIGADPGAYHVMVAVSGASNFCPTAQGDVNVGIEGAGTTQVRLRVYPAPNAGAPPQEQMKLIPGGPGDYSLNNVAVDPGVMATGFVRMGTTGVQSYLRFIPLGARDAYVETFTATDGKFEARMLNQVHDVLVVPTVAGFAPRLVEGWTPGMPLSVDGGTLLTGIVRDPGGAAIANAQVQVELDGVPSTLATTTGAGAFSVRAHVPASMPDVRIEVTPPAASGLPRIAGGSIMLTATLPITVQYNAALVLRDLGGTVVRRGGVAQGNVPVKIVGTIGAVASITAGVTVPANGELRIATTANAGGAIPGGTLAPAAPLFAVSQIGAQFCVDAIDLSAAVPATIDAPVAVQIDTQLRSAAQTPLQSAMIDFAPAGALALAGAPTIHGVANASGNVSVGVPAGALFEVRVSDPLGRAAQLLYLDVPTAMLSATYDLKPSKRVIGTLQLSGNPQPVGRATIQFLCTLCSGVERSRPMAEGASSSAGEFSVPVFDPGIMQ